MNQLSISKDFEMDAEYLMKFVNQLDTIILTHHGMKQEFYNDLCALKQESSDLCKMLSKKGATPYDLCLSKMNAYYYDEYIKILECFLNTPGAEADEESFGKVKKATENMKDMISTKKKRYQDFNDTLKNDLDFFLQQMEIDLPLA